MLLRFCLGVVFLSCNAASRADMVLFDEFPIGTQIDTEYLNVGLMFSTSGVAPAEIIETSRVPRVMQTSASLL